MHHIFAFEEFKRFRKIDLNALVILSVIYLLVSLFTQTLAPSTEFVLNMFVLAILVSFTVLIVRKSMAAIFFYLLSAILVSFTKSRIAGFDLFLVFLIAGFIFEFIFLIVKLDVKNIPLDVVVATGISIASIPLAMALVLSKDILLAMLPNFIHLELLGFLLGVIGSIISFLIWFNLRHLKMFVRFEYGNFMF